MILKIIDNQYGRIS